MTTTRFMQLAINSMTQVGCSRCAVIGEEIRYVRRCARHGVAPFVSTST
jgi:hypothetical protein